MLLSIALFIVFAIFMLQLITIRYEMTSEYFVRSRYTGEDWFIHHDEKIALSERYSYYRLCESYRIGNKVGHRAIVNLGDLSELPDKEDHKLLADRIEEIIRGEEALFAIQNKKVEELAHRYAGIISIKG